MILVTRVINKWKFWLYFGLIKNKFLINQKTYNTVKIFKVFWKLCNWTLILLQLNIRYSFHHHYYCPPYFVWLLTTTNHLNICFSFFLRNVGCVYIALSHFKQKHQTHSGTRLNDQIKWFSKNVQFLYKVLFIWIKYIIFAISKSQTMFCMHKVCFPRINNHKTRN